MAYHQNVDPDIVQGIENSLDLDSLLIGQKVLLELAEGLDLEDELSLELTFEKTAPEGECPELRISDGNVPDKIISKNIKYHLPNPTMIGGLIIIRGGCTYRKGYSAFASMVHINHIDKNRHLWTAMEASGQPDQPKGMEYFPFVRNYVLLG